MPRLLQKQVTVKKRVERFDRYQIRRAYKWVDPFPEIHGTLPEKMVYAELTRLGIPFLFLNDIRFTIPEIGFDKWYQADFVIPSAKLIIEVQGAYWHSMDKTVQADAFKFAIYETKGYKVLAWWDYDIIARLHDLVIAEPLLLSLARYNVSAGRSAELPVQRRTKVDTSKGIRTLNARRKTGQTPRVKARTLRKSVASYAR